ncbi:MAG: exodeoxyribonuclease VII large subunit [Euzebya sp.]
MSQRTWTPSEIGARIDQVVSQRMAASFWVRGEIADLGRTSRGMAFLSLVETAADGRILATLPATMSPGKARLVDRRMARVGQPLTEGIEIRLRGHLSYFVPGGRLSFAVDDVDPAHTAGAMALARRDLLRALQQEGLMDANAARPVPVLPLRLGLVTRGGSQAYHDLIEELGASGLPFAVTMVSAHVQGVHAPTELAGALVALGQQDLDLILLTRGGGADLELAAFDDARVARAVAGCRLPVWTGIGHHLDQPICEQVAGRAFKTPTALAQGVVAQVRQAIARTEAQWLGVARTATSRLMQARTGLDTAGRRIQGARVVLRGAEGRLSNATHRLRAGAAATTSGAQRRLATSHSLIDAYDPRRLLARGWSVTTTSAGVLVTAPVPAGTRLVTTTQAGPITSEVIDDE